MIFVKKELAISSPNFEICIYWMTDIHLQPSNPAIGCASVVTSGDGVMTSGQWAMGNGQVTERPRLVDPH